MYHKRVSSLKTPEDFLAYLKEISVELPFDKEMQSGPQSPLGQPFIYKGKKIGNRFAVLPMEGWDGTADGKPTELTHRRWRRFGVSGAKLVWGGEAAAVVFSGRSNPGQLVIDDNTVKSISELREAMVDEHQQHYGQTDDLYAGLQLTHSGRFSRPNEKSRLEPKILYHHPILDRKFGIDKNLPVLSDPDIQKLVDHFVQAARLSYSAGFSFVDLKHCHGYLGHEFLTAYDRPGHYGGSFENRTRFIREVVQGIRAAVPQLEIGVRLSAFDGVPYKKNDSGQGEPEKFDGKYRHAFGGDGTGTGIDLSEPEQFLKLLASLEVTLVCLSAGSPYYNPHVQRPALFPPSDGYMPPEDPLAGVARQIRAVSDLKKRFPQMVFVGSAYTYLQEWIPNVSQNVVRTDQADFVGLGRIMLSYPEIVADIINGKPLDRKRICRTFSDCTSAPRNGLPSGCYPLDEFYKGRPEAARVKNIRAGH